MKFLVRHTCKTYFYIRFFTSLSRKYSSQIKGEQTPLKRLLNEATSYGEANLSEPELQWATQPYATEPTNLDTTELEDPQDTTVILFPGQGTHTVGMGLRLVDVPAAKELYELASSVVGWDVWRTCTEGPANVLDEHCQVALLVTSLAALEALRDSRPSALERVRAVAGFSLGEFAALVFAGALSFERALRVVAVREVAMRAASRVRPGGMLTVWLTPDAQLSLLLREARETAQSAKLPEPVCAVANHLYAGCKVVAGDEVALRYVERAGAGRGVRRAARLGVGGAFHCALMAPAVEAVRAALTADTAADAVRTPGVRTWAGTKARIYRNGPDVARGLVELTTAPVRWEQTLHAMYARRRGQGFPLTVAIGPGGALRSFLRQVNAPAWDRSLQVPV